MFKFETALAEIKGLPPRFLPRLKQLGLTTVRDALWHFPVRYEDFSKVYRIAELQPNQHATVQGVVQEIGMRRSWRRRHMTITEALIGDETGSMRAVWFNQPYLAQTLRQGKLVSLAGKVLESDEGLYFSSPAFELLGARGRETTHTAGVIAVYPETRGLTSKGIRYLVKAFLKAVPRLPDPLPESVRAPAALPELNAALRAIHFPHSIEEATEARRRFAFEDLFVLQLFNLLQKKRLAREKAPAFRVSDDEIRKDLSRLPFELTPGQHKALNEIVSDLQKPAPMNRLLQGDVGSGKTVVAALAALVAVRNGYQVAFMAPTEVLARQHFNTLRTLFATLDAPVAFLTASHAEVRYGEGLESPLPKQRLKKEIANGTIAIVLGTHSLIENSMGFKNLGLVIIDEQHRFGVEQRAALVRGKDSLPHFLSMSATPIPRTLTLTLFGDLDLSLITELPKGRRPITTKIVAPENRAKAYAFVREEIRRGRQAFVICPRIEEQIANGESAYSAEVPLSGTKAGQIVKDKRAALWDDVKNVTEEYEKLSKKIFPDLRIAMLHGKMPARGGSASGGKPTKESVMKDFKEGKIDILVSTSVIEVGVDVPNASIMLIESADRFGLAQLYQFRGRVGRGEHQSYCLLFTESSSQSTARRLKALLEAKNGFELAERDLALRGPGQFLGEKQTGLPDIAMASLNNLELIRDVRAAADTFLKIDPTLSNHAPLKTKLAEFKSSIHLE
ncbi:MAG: ATP-dependent DNA helicase RecG [bacterium]|nr:ATP-dependent DNA helicase RecG [bacterium]